MIVDTRAPLRWWSRIFGQTTEGPIGAHVTIWVDQVVHISMIALWLLFGAPLVQ
jgi:hypothetical protein